MDKMGNTPYDDVFRTLTQDCTRLIIPVVNELFKTEYQLDSSICIESNEHMMVGDGGDIDKVITDFCCVISDQGGVSKRYHIECQSTEDSSILVRIIQYDAQIAVRHRMSDGTHVIIEFPESALMLLRNAKERTYMVTIRTPGGSVEYTVPTIVSSSYTVDELFSKQLFFLIPFYIFKYEANFRRAEKDEEVLDTWNAVYSEVANRLRQTCSEGIISVYEHRTLQVMSQVVLDAIAKRFDKIKERIGDVMGGQILEYDAKTIRQQGKLEGLQQGKLESQIKMYNLVKKGLLSLDAAAQAEEMTPEAFKQSMDAYFAAL